MAKAPTNTAKAGERRPDALRLRRAGRVPPFRHPVTSRTSSEGERMSGAGRCQRLKAKMCEEPRRSSIPRIRNDESMCVFMERTKNCSFFSLRFHFYLKK